MSARTVLVVEDVPKLSHLLSTTVEIDERFTPAANAAQQERALSSGASDYIVTDGDLSPLLDALAR